MGNVGGGEILVILLVALVVLGPERLPGVARQLGNAMGEVRKFRGGLEREIRDAMTPTPNPAEDPGEPSSAPPGSAPQLP
jgi:Tat protein translocase TatB subunit